jgi:hypothetical protein
LHTARGPLVTMLTIFDSESPLNEQEMSEVREFANARIGLWRRRSIYSVAALLASCASVIPFSKGHSLHSHAEPFGRLLVLLSMGLLVVCVLCTGFFYGAWQALRDIEKGQG